MLGVNYQPAAAADTYQNGDGSESDKIKQPTTKVGW